MATIQHSVPGAPSIAGERLPKRSIVGYGLGDFANNLAFTLGTTFLLYYYTDVAEVADPGAVATYRAVRAGVGTLLDQLRESAELLARRPSGNLLATHGNSLAPLASGLFTDANRTS